MQQEQLGSQKWRELLKSLDAEERKRIIHELGIPIRTLDRWIRGDTTLPHPDHIRQLLKVLPAQKRALFIRYLQQDPNFVKYEEEIHFPDNKAEIPSEFYSRILEANVVTSGYLRYTTLHQIILMQIIRQLDLDHLGLSVIILKCTPPTHGGKVKTLYHQFSLGAHPWSTVIEQRGFFLGAESLAGQAIMKHGAQGIYDRRNDESASALLSVYRDNYTASAAASLIQKDQRIAGCLFVRSTQPGFFTPSRLTIMHHYCNLLVITIDDREFYEQSQVELRLTPCAKIQQEYLAQFHQRVSTVIKQAQRNGYLKSPLEAEQEVRQHIEAELIEKVELDPLC